VGDLQLKIRKSDAEIDRLRGVEDYQKQQMGAMEGAIGDKNRVIEDLEKHAEACRGSFEEKIVYMQMQLNAAKTRDEGRDKVLYSSRRYPSFPPLYFFLFLQELQGLRKAAEKAELVAVLQSRLMELEPELQQAKERCRELDKLLSAASMMKVWPSLINSQCNLKFGQ